MIRLGPITSSIRVETKASTSSSWWNNSMNKWSTQAESNCQRPDWKSGILPLNYVCMSLKMARRPGHDPGTEDLESTILPIKLPPYKTSRNRVWWLSLGNCWNHRVSSIKETSYGGEERIRTAGLYIAGVLLYQLSYSPTANCLVSQDLDFPHLELFRNASCQRSKSRLAMPVIRTNRANAGFRGFTGLQIHSYDIKL